METIFGNQVTFTLPSGKVVTIREQNGADDDVLSNPMHAKDMMNISNFISGIVVSSDITPNGKLSPEQVHRMPVLDKYCILINSRIFSLGETLEFSYKWGNGEEFDYEQNLNELIFDYAQEPTQDMLDSKPNAIPYYPMRGEVKDLEFSTKTGKRLMFDLLTSEGEAYVLGLPLDKQTKNQELVARNLRLQVGEKWEKVQNFAIFSVSEMRDIRSFIKGVDPIYSGTVDIENPSTGQKTKVAVMGIDGFFYTRED